MKTMMRLQGWLLLVALAVSATRLRAENGAAVAEIAKLRDSGLSDDTIVGFVRSRDTNYELSADDMLGLMKRGFSQNVLSAMLASGKNGAVPSSITYPGSPIPPSPTFNPPGAPPPPTYTQPSAPPPVYGSPSTPPQGIGADAAYFYQELSPYGRWLLAEDGRWYWQPTVATTTPGWRPYADEGNWVYTDGGWYWSSTYPWGWAAFHHGRWEMHPHLGWIWLPDRVWGPAWVAWRGDGEYCGWAPLPPGAVFDVSVGRFLYHGRRVEMDFGFGLDWMHFNFVRVSELGGPMHWHPRGEAEVRAIYGRSRIVANYRVERTVINGESRQHFFNAGIEPGRVGALRGRPVEVVTVRDLHGPAVRGQHERFVPEEKTLNAYRPKFGPSNEHRRGGER